MPHFPTYPEFLSLSEALKPSEFRDYYKAWKQANGDKKYDHIFGSKTHRLYLELGESKEKPEIKDNSLIKDIEKALESNGYKSFHWRTTWPRPSVGARPPRPR